MEYNFRDIEKKWQDWWTKNKIYNVSNDSPKPKYYVLDMFPYPSGAGLHVGHPLGYIASDIYARFKRLKGYNVLHPMGYDAFGLPAEQYAIDHGIHPAVSTETNIKNFRSQLDKIGFCFDWDREVNTSKPEFYKWTQWIFLQLFNSYFCHTEKKALPISLLVKKYETKGAMPKTGQPISGKHFTAEQWKAFSEKEKADILMKRRLAYCGYGEVNWCEALGTVLANDEVINGVSERGGYPVVKKTLRQWYLRITEYADRLLEDLDTVDFSDAMKEMQSNWIGKSSGAEIDFDVKIDRSEVEEREIDPLNPSIERVDITITESIAGEPLRVYTTRPDTIFGVDFMVIAPEHELVEEITTPQQKQAVEEYITYVKSRSERERMAEKKISGVFTGSFALNPFNGREIPIWISEYVLAGYGTGAIMAVPCGDQRDFLFAKHFNIPITNIIGPYFNGEEANPTKDAVLENSDFLNDLVMINAIDVVLDKIEAMGIGVRKVNYKMRDAAFSRQRYWGEPFPIKWINGIAYPLDEKELPLELPHVDTYKPGPEGEGPLANIPEWTSKNLETNTMPGYAGSSWYFLRYMDPHNDKEFCNRKVSDYWNQVDLYIGGTEHAVGHLLYSRMWTKALYDLGYIGYDEPYKRLVNQGMIQGKSLFLAKAIFYSKENSDDRIELITTNDIIARENPNGEKFEFQLKDKTYQYQSHTEYRFPVNFSNGSSKISYDELKTAFKESNYLQRILPEINEQNFDEKILWRNDSTGKFIFARIGEDNSDVIFEAREEVEKMSKSKHNVFSPDDLVFKYGADTFRMYEMFLGPVEMSKPWDTKGIEGVHRFLKKLWRLFYDELKGKVWNEDKATEAELKILHRTIKKIEEDTERFSFNTGVSAFMIAVNDLTDLKCYKREILEPLLILLAPYAPHITEELYRQLNSSEVSPLGGDLEGASILNATYPKLEEKYLVESSKEYPVSINGKMRTTIDMALGIPESEVEKIVLANAIVQKWLEGKPPKKIIYKEGKMVNVVI